MSGQYLVIDLDINAAIYKTVAKASKEPLNFWPQTFILVLWVAGLLTKRKGAQGASLQPTRLPFFHTPPFLLLLLHQPLPLSSFVSKPFLFANMSSLYTHSHSFSPARALSSQMRGTLDIESQYLAELLAEHQKLGPFMQVLPICSRLLNQEIMRVSGMAHNQGFGDYDRMQYGSPSPMVSPNLISNISGTCLSAWSVLQQQVNHHRRGFPQGMSMDWHGAPPSPSSYFVKKIRRFEIPVYTYPTFNFVGRLLGPRGNSLKRVEAATGCHVYIRGKGSIKDPGKEENLRGRPGYEHLTEPLHILVEAELPANIIDARLRHAQEILEELLMPVDESQDYYKRQQLRELAMLNSGLREDSPHPSGSLSPFNTSGMKRSKTGC